MIPSEFIQKGELRSKTGSATQPEAGGHRIVLNFCDASGNDWADDTPEKIIGKRWDKVALEYRRWYRSQHYFRIGELKEVNVQSDTCIVNMLVKDENGQINTEAVEKCIDKVGEMAVNYGSSVHVQKGDNNWDKVASALIEKVIKRGKMVTVYSEGK
jgi:hypothetical protein